MNNVVNRCQNCGLELTSGSPLGVCARCLLETALPESIGRDSDSTQVATINGDSDSASQSSGTPDAQASERSSGNERRYFGDYELLEELACGGMGTVFRARQTRLNRIVALKVIRHGQLASETEVERFYTEAESAASLDHPGIISVYEVGEQDGQHYFSMRLIEHGNIADWINKQHAESDRVLNRRKQDECVRILIQIARAVHFAHQRQILHRDLKPHNVLLDVDEQPVVTDFGLAQRITTDSRLTTSGTLIGTPSYMAPEQAVGNRTALTTSTDVYGLGAILYQMLTGRPPFQGETPVETVIQVLNTEPQRPSAISPVDPDLETICLKCLDKDPTRRYGSAEALADDLERWRKHEPIQARRADIKDQWIKWTRRRPLVAGLTAVLVTVTVASFIAISWQWRETRLALELARQATIDEATARSAILTPREVLLHEGPVMSSTFSPDGLRVLTASHDKTAVIWNAVTGERVASLLGHTGVLSQAKFSPDSKRILTVSDDGTDHYTFVDPAGRTSKTVHLAEPGDKTVRIWDATSGQQIAVLTGHQAAITDACFSPDGRTVVTCSFDKTARLWEVSTGKEILKLDGHDGAVLAASFSPDGQHVLTSSFGTDFLVSTHADGDRSSGSHTVNEPNLAIAWDAKTGQRLFGLRNYGTSSRVRATYSPDGRWIATAAEDPRNVAIWNATTGKFVASLGGHTHEVNRIRFTRDSQRLVTASSDATAAVYNVPAGTRVATMRGHDATILDARFSNDGRRVVTASGDGTARIWEAASGKGMALLKGHEDRVYSASFSPDGFLVTTASLDGQAAIWHSATMQQLAIELKGHDGKLTSIEFSPDGRFVLTAARDGSARLWSANTGRPVATLQGHGSLTDSELRNRLLDDVRSAQFSPDGSLVVTATEETHGTISTWLSRSPKKIPFNPVRVFIAETGTETTAVEGMNCGGQFAAFSPDGRLVVATPDAKVRRYTRTLTGMSSSGERQTDTSVRILNVKTGEEVHKLGGHTGVVYKAVFSPNGQTLATVDERRIRLFDVEQGKQIAVSNGALSRQVQIEFSADGQRLLCRGYGNNAYLLSADDLSLVLELRGHAETLTSARFSEDGLLIATASADGTARIWNAQTGKVNHVLTNHRKRVYFAVFDPTGSLLATSSQDRKVRLWDVQSGKQLQVLEGHKGQVVNASFSRDGRWLGTASEDYSARLWPLYVHSHHD